MERYMITKSISQFLFVIILFVFGFLALIKFNIISLNSSELPLAIVLNHNEIGLKKGSNYQLEASIYPKDVYYEKVIWSSSNPSVVSVNENTGYLESHKEGVAIIKANVLLNNLESECIVKVSKNDILVKNIKLNNEEINLIKGDSFKIGYNLLPSNATTHNFDYISSDNSIVVVNDKGVIKAVNSGKAIVTIKSRINNVSDSIVVNVYNKLNDEENDVTLTNSFVELGVGIKSKLNNFILPVYASQNINWFSTNNNVAMVSNDGNIIGISEGTAKIIATSIDGKISICEVVVKNDSTKKEEIEILDDNININVGMSKSINYNLYLSNAQTSSIKWSSSNNDVAIVENGVITAKNEGEAEIKVSILNGKFKDSVKVNVNKGNIDTKVEEIIFTNTLYNAMVNDTINLIPNIVPVNSKDYYVEWDSSDKSVAIVENGVVKCLKEGKVIITASVLDVSSSVEIIVGSVYPSLITIEDGDYFNLALNESRYLIKKIVPVNSTNQLVTWLSSNSSIVSVNENGLIKGLSKGNAIITVKTINDKSYSVNVKVS